MRVSHFLFSLSAAFILSSTLAQQITVSPGDSLSSLAKRHGITTEALLVANNLKTDVVNPGTVLKLPGGASGPAATYTVQAGDTLYDIAIAVSVSVSNLIAFNNLDGTLIRPGQVLQLSGTPGLMSATQLVVTIKPGDSLWAIGRRHEVAPALIAEANSMNIDATLRPGSQLTIPGRYVSGDPAASADIGGAATPTITVAPGDSLWSIARRYNTSVSALMAANELASDNLRVGQTLRLVPGTDLLRAEAATETYVPPPGTEMVWPATGIITSRFGHRLLRINGTNMHYGLDLDGNTGDPIFAATAGVVTFSGWRGGYGNLVIVQADGVDYYYAHASELIAQVGQAVQPGQIIARIGTTGNVTGAHLHFEVRVDGTPVDPLPMLETKAGPR
jgi:murein DD-endopeptidase MepM/ murein hydrolase activator NlpD